MTVSGHIAAATLLAPLGSGPVGAFLLGVLQHALLDRATPEFNLNWTNRRELVAHLPFLAAEASLALLAIWLAWRSGPLAWWSVAGYVVTELPDAVRSARDPSVWMKGQHWMYWHRPLRGASPPAWSARATLRFAAVLLGAAFLMG